MTTPLAGLDAANHLLGMTLPNGWTVVEKLEKELGGTGGHFSVCYTVKDSRGTKAFLKALNLGMALNAPGDDTLRLIESLVRTFNFERDTMSVCRGHRMKRIAQVLDDGKIQPAGSAYPVYYLIIEWAPGGDIRKHIKTLKAVDLAWNLRTLHQTAVALSQLHTNGYAHQDLKPSNIFVFDSSNAKVGDLGCADHKTGGSPRGVCSIAGDKGYAPPELLYNEVSSDWNRRRMGCDLYLLGSMVVFFFTGVSMTAALFDRIETAHRPGFWPHDYRTVLPYVRQAFGEAVAEIIGHIPQPVRDPLASAIRELCDPDPMHRGHPMSKNANQYAVERYVSLFDLLATKAECGLIKT